MGIKLRESCDSCLTAKVKCNKGRPVCQRCLTNGHDCQYSPSARAGRKNRNGVSKASSSTAPPRRRPASIDIPPNRSNSMSSSWSAQHTQNPQDRPVLESSNNTSAFNHHNAQVFTNNTPPLSREDQTSDTARGEDKIPNTHVSERNGMDHQMPTPPFSMPYADPFGTQNQSAPVSAATDILFPDFSSSTASPTMSLHPTATHDECMIDGNRFGAGSMPDPFSNPFDIMPLTEVSSFHTESFQKTPTTEHLSDMDGLANKDHSTLSQSDQVTDCDCFAGCLHALQQLHDNSWSTPAATHGHIPFTVILDINRDALKNCHNIMKCVNCSTKSGSSISTMLIATLNGNIISL